MTYVSARKQAVLVPWWTLNSRLSSQILSLMLVGLCSAPLGQNKMFQVHSLRGWYHRGANLSHRRRFSVFQTPGERRTQFFSDIMRLGRIPALLNKSTFPSAAYMGSLFEESLIKATQVKLQDISCYFYTLIIYNSSSWGTNKHVLCAQANHPWRVRVIGQLLLGLFDLLHQPWD